MVLEYVEGETLADRLSRERQLPEDSLRRLLDEVLSGLAEMHEAGYVHRDIKPGNLMLREEDGSAVVLDFGAARQAVGRRSQRLTTILTPGYAPIEQYDSQADDVGPWSDIYALGMVAYRCISGLGDGDLPDAVTRGRTQRKEQIDLTPAIEAGNGQYSAKLLEAIDWAIQVDEGDRPQTVTEWQAALAGGKTKIRTGKPARKPATRPIETTGHRPGIGWAGAVLMMVVGALIAAGAWWAWQEYPELFGQGAGDTQTVAQQTAPTDMTGETPQEPETGESGELAASTEQTPLPDKAEAEEPGTGKPLPAEEDEVTRLLATAESDLKARRLTRPVGNNAWDRFLRVLELDPANPDAISGMERVIGSYGELFDAAVEKEDFDKAAGYLMSIRDLNPDSPVLEEGEQRLAQARQERKERLAEIERQRQEAEEKMRQLAGEMVDIPGGTFRMGDLNDGGIDDERPVHSVTVPAFRMGKYEVTFSQWDACVADGGCRDYTPGDEGWGRDNRPVINVSWDDVQGFIDWLNDKTGGNFRLPTEAEWEYAVRAGSTTIYSWGNNIGSKRANCDGCGSRWDGDRTAPVGSFSANDWGLHDLHGNVSEWAQDCWNDSYLGAPTDGRASTSGNCSWRVFRGGSWEFNPWVLRSAARSWFGRSDRFDFIGFRLVQDK